MLKTNNKPATIKQLSEIRKLTGEDTSQLYLTAQEAETMIEGYSKKVKVVQQNNGVTPFNDAHVTIIEADQGGGKSCYATAKVVSAYDNDCVKNYFSEKGIDLIVKSYDRRERVAKIVIKGVKKYVRIPADYKLHSDMRIFSNYHLYGLPYVYLPNFGTMLKWLKDGLIVNGWLLLDEYYVGGNARDSMSAFGKEMEKQSFQMRKMQLEVVIITPHARLIDKWTRSVPTKHILCSYDKDKMEITASIKEKGKKKYIMPPFDASLYFGNYNTNERINK